jgi:hypothetical protein
LASVITMMSLPISLLLLAPSVLGFTFTTLQPRLSALCAKKAENPKPAAAGWLCFGSNVTKVPDRGRLFYLPALEPQVKGDVSTGTIRYWSPVNSNEMYQRRSNIRLFEFQLSDHHQKRPETMSFTDMISASSTDDEENLSASATNADPELPLASPPPL